VEVIKVLKKSKKARKFVDCSIHQARKVVEYTDSKRFCSIVSKVICAKTFASLFDDHIVRIMKDFFHEQIKLCTITLPEVFSRSLRANISLDFVGYVLLLLKFLKCPPYLLPPKIMHLDMTTLL